MPSVRIFFGNSRLLALPVALSIMAGCANPNHLGPAQAFEAWKHQKIGTTKEFTGAYEYAGKTFPVRIVQHLKSRDAECLVLENAYYLSDFHVKTDGSGIVPNLAGVTDFRVRAQDFLAGIPPGGGRKKVLFSGRPVPGSPPITVTFTPNHRTFQIQGKTVAANLYEFDQTASGIHRNINIKVWFAPEVPGGCVAMESSGGWGGDLSPQGFASQIQRGKSDANTILYSADRRLLKLKSVRTP